MLAGARPPAPAPSPRSRRAFLLGRAPAAPPVARIGPACLARHGIVCRSCGDACAAGAIAFAAGRVPAPAIAAARCTGCAACLPLCPAAAISLEAADAG